MHLVNLLLLTGLAASPSLAVLPARLYIYPPPSSTSISFLSSSTTLTPGEANAALSHHLGISSYERLPQGLQAGRKKQVVFGNGVGGETEGEGEEQERVLVVVYGSNGKDIVPDALLSASQSLSISSPPSHQAWDTLISLYIDRFTHFFSRPLSSVFGKEGFLELLKEGDWSEWAKEWEGKVGEWVRWGEERLGVQVKPKEEYKRLLGELDFQDSSFEQLAADLALLTSYVDTPISSRLATLRLSGLHTIERRHTRASAAYRRASSLLKDYLSAALTLSPGVEKKVMLLVVPTPPEHTRIGKRTQESLLAPFKTSPWSFQSPALLARRSDVFGGSSFQSRAPSRGIPIVSSSRTCYDSAAVCKNATAECNGKGECVEGHRTIGGTCFVCQCGTKQEGGKRVVWSGEMCQKKDVSNDFVLLAGSTIGLLILFVASVAVLYGVGREELPQGLMTVGNGVGKKHD